MGRPISTYGIRLQPRSPMRFPSPKGEGFFYALLKGWAVDGDLHVNSAPPFEIFAFPQSPVFGFYATRPDIVPGVPFYRPDSQPGDAG